MKTKSIIKKVNFTTEWVCDMVLKEKPNGKHRICLDPKNFNKNIVLNQYLIVKILA